MPSLSELCNEDDNVNVLLLRRKYSSDHLRFVNLRRTDDDDNDDDYDNQPTPNDVTTSLDYASSTDVMTSSVSMTPPPTSIYASDTQTRLYCVVLLLFVAASILGLVYACVARHANKYSVNNNNNKRKKKKSLDATRVACQRQSV